MRKIYRQRKTNVSSKDASGSAHDARRLAQCKVLRVASSLRPTTNVADRVPPLGMRCAARCWPLGLVVQAESIGPALYRAGLSALEKNTGKYRFIQYSVIKSSVVKT